MKIAVIENNIVTNIIICDSIELANEVTKSHCVEASVNCGIGYTWDGVNFIPPQPFPSWTFNSELNVWESPISIPTDGKDYQWDESTTSWIQL